MPLDIPEASSSSIALSPPPSTARLLLGSGNPSSTAKIQVAVVEELARASVDLIEASSPASPEEEEPDDGRALVRLWARRGPAESRRMRRASQIALGEIEVLARGEEPAAPSSRELPTSPRVARPGSSRYLLVVLAASLVASAVTLALAARFVL